jgi:hypothetical protein
MYVEQGEFQRAIPALERALSMGQAQCELAAAMQLYGAIEMTF